MAPLQLCSVNIAKHSFSFRDVRKGMAPRFLDWNQTNMCRSICETNPEKVPSRARASRARGAGLVFVSISRGVILFYLRVPNFERRQKDPYPGCRGLGACTPEVGVVVETGFSGIVLRGLFRRRAPVRGRCEGCVFR